MEGSVLDLNKKPKDNSSDSSEQSVLAKKPAAESESGEQSVLAKKPEVVKKPEEQSVLSQKSESAGDGSVLANTKPITFYKKAWFWIIIGVVVLGGAGAGVFFGIQGALAAEAIEKYGDNSKAASTALHSFESAFSDAYYDSDFKGYYYSSDERSAALRNKCLNMFGVSGEDFDLVSKNTIYTGEEASAQLGTGKTRELSDRFKKTAEGLNNARDNIGKCTEMLNETLKNGYEVTIGEFTVEKEDSYYPDCKLPVTIKNTSDMELKFRVEVKAIDENGEVYYTDYFYSKVLAPGESSSDDLFTYVYSKSSVAKLKTAKFEYTVTEVSY